MPQMQRVARALVLVAFWLLLAPAAGYAAPCEPGQPVDNLPCDPSALDLAPPAATPELESVLIFAVGLFVLAGVLFIPRRPAARPERPDGE